MRKPEAVDRHELTLAIWDRQSPLVMARQSAIKVGVKCAHGCDLAGIDVELRDHAGVVVGRAILGATPWPDTTALYWTDVSFAVPAAEGCHDWMAVVPVPAGQAEHDEASAPCSLLIVRPPEHCVTVMTASDAGTAIEGAEVRAGCFRAATGPAGLATLDLPGGTYEVHAWKRGYELASTTIAVTGDVRIGLALVSAPVMEEEYWR